MSNERFRQVEAIFHAALEVPAESRPGYLREHTDGDDALLADVASLVAAFEQQESLNRLSEQSQPAPQPARTIGVYDLDRLIGKGGMGAVYLAHRGDGQYEQKVAVKLIALPLAADFLRERFRQERQILATLDHPNITRLLAGGVTPEGDPYLVMEYVDGQPLDAYCDQRRLSLAERLGLFVQVLHAVDYAHRNLIVHGDLKPSNILVTGEGVVKVVDFGTSRFLDDETRSTTVAAMTPKYTSPEQLRGERLTTTSDVFSLGLILYELLTGGSAFRAGGSLLSVFERAIHETNPSEPALAVTEEAAALRRASLAELRPSLRGDLSSIALKALAYDPSHRYRSVAEFTADIENYRSGRPVLARRQTFLYRTGKFIRRHRLPVAAATAVVLGFVSVGAYAYHQQQTALEEGRRAKVMNTFLMRVFESLNPAYGGRRNMTPADLINRADKQAGTMLAKEPAVRGQFLLTLGGNLIFTRGISAAITAMRKAAEAARQSGDFGLEAEALASLGYLQSLDNDCAAALQSGRRAEAIRAGHSRGVSREWRLSIALNQVQMALICGGDSREIRRTSQDALALARQIPDDSVEEGTSPRTMKAFALTLASLTQGCTDGKHLLDEALRMTDGDEALAASEVYALTSRGGCLLRQGDTAQAVGVLDKASGLSVEVYGEDAGEAQLQRALLAYALAEKGDSQRAIQEARRSVAGLDCRIPLACLLASTYAMQALLTSGNLDDALPLARQIASSNNALALSGRTGLFVALTESHQDSAATPYRAAAEKLAPTLPRGLWRAKVERALKH